MQELWILKLDWSDPLPDSITQSWVQFTKSLKSIEKLNSSRYVLSPCVQYIELHGLADSSSITFAADVCIQTSNHFQTSCNLFSSKLQIVPLMTITIPRLKLSACLLLSNLVI